MEVSFVCAFILTLCTSRLSSLSPSGYFTHSAATYKAACTKLCVGSGFGKEEQPPFLPRHVCVMTSW